MSSKVGKTAQGRQPGGWSTRRLVKKMGKSSCFIGRSKYMHYVAFKVSRAYCVNLESLIKVSAMTLKGKLTNVVHFPEESGNMAGQV